MEDPLAPSLVHIATRLSGHGLGYFLQYCPNIQVLELEGGDIFEYWCKNTKKDTSNATRSSFDDTTFSPLPVLLYLNETLPNTLRKLKIVARWEDYVWRIYKFFERNVKPPAVLKEVFINIPIFANEYQIIIRGLRGPVIERFAVTSPEVVEDFVHAIQNLNGDDTFVPAFESLEEFWIPWGGVLETASDDPEADPILAKLLSHAPALRHLYFDALENQHSGNRILEGPGNPSCHARRSNPDRATGVLWADMAGLDRRREMAGDKYLNDGYICRRSQHQSQRCRQLGSRCSHR
ncbi:hypothetical protein C8J57DRAFT_713507 [Mycena rebaudengoi]|nr:hypothetical protein C8J57DRAFT_713507 [Mycena rebaudengoi]